MSFDQKSSRRMKAAAEGTEEELKQQPFTRSGYFSSSQTKVWLRERKRKSLFLLSGRKEKKTFVSIEPFWLEEKSGERGASVKFRLNPNWQRRIQNKALQFLVPDVTKSRVFKGQLEDLFSLPKWPRLLTFNNSVNNTNKPTSDWCFLNLSIHWMKTKFLEFLARDQLRHPMPHRRLLRSKIRNNEKSSKLLHRVNVSPNSLLPGKNFVNWFGYGPSG